MREVAHCEICHEDCRVPASSPGQEGSGFMIAQARLGPGADYCMRTLRHGGACLRDHVSSCEHPKLQGALLGEKQFVQEWIATSRMELDQVAC